MLVWIRQKKRFLAQFMVYPLIFVFIALYGTTQITKQVALDQETALWVNDVRISYTAYDTALRQVKNALSGSLVAPEKSPAQIAVEQVARQELARQLAGAMSLKTSNDRVDQIIAGQFSDSRGAFNQFAFVSFITQNGFSSPESYREFVRGQLDVELALSYINGTGIPSREEIERAVKQQNELREIEVLYFDNEEAAKDFEVNDEEARDFFDTHIERYRFVKRMKIDYVEAKPDDYVVDATFTQENLQRWFNSQKEEQFLVPVERNVAVLEFRKTDFDDEITFTEEELREEYEATKNTSLEPARYRIRYVSESLVPTDATVELYLAENSDKFNSLIDAANVRHILFDNTSNSATKEAELIQRLEDIRSRIVTEEDFVREAKEHSMQKTSRGVDGALEYMRSNTVNMEAAEVVFEMVPGTCTPVVKSPFGLFLFWVASFRPTGSQISVEDVKDGYHPDFWEFKDTLKDKARGILNKKLEEIGDASLSSVPELNVVETDWIAKRDVPTQHKPDLFLDHRQIIDTLTDVEPGKVVLHEGINTFFLLEIIEKEDPRQKDYEEVRESLEIGLRTKKWDSLIIEKAQKAAEEIREGTHTFDEIRDKYGLPMTRFAGLRKFPTKQRAENSRVNADIIKRAFSVNEGQVSGPFKTPSGQSLLEVRGELEERIGEFEDVGEEAEAAYKKIQAARLAQDAVWEAWMELDNHDDDLAAAAKSASLELLTSDYFEPGNPVPGFTTGSALSYVAAGLRIEGATSQVFEDPPRTGNPEQDQQPIRGYYLIQASTIEESHLPGFEAVSEKVLKDVAVGRAAPATKAKADLAAGALASLLSEATGPISASRSIDLEAFAKERDLDHRGPIDINYQTRIPTFPGEHASASVVATAFNLSLGEISGVIPIAEPVDDKNKLGERVLGYAIIQLIGIKDSDKEPVSEGTAFRILSQSIRSIVQSDWLDRQMNEADIEPNKHRLPDDVVEELTKEEEKS